MKGFGGASKRAMPLDYKEFPDFATMALRRFPNRSKTRDAPKAVAEVSYDDLSDAKEAIELFVGVSAAYNNQFIGRFMTAALSLIHI